MSNSQLLRRPLPSSLRPVSGISEPFFVHAPSAKVLPVAKMCAAEAIGAIYTMPTGNSRNATLRTTVDAHRDIAGGASTVLLDANRYHGKNRLPASAPLNLDWLQRQWDAGITWAITDSGYLERDAEDDLRALFASAQQLERRATGKFFLSLPADSHWVSARANELRAMVEEYGIPVVYLFGATGDPLATKRAVHGLLHLLDSPVPSALMRTDQAAIGALAGSAAFGAMGISTSLRHIYPPDKKGGGFRPSSFPSAFLPQGLSFHRTDTLARAIALSPEELHWACHCDRCQGMRLDSIFDDTAAFTHSIHSLADVTRHILTDGGSAASLAAWASKCQTAQFTHFDVEGTTGMKWEPPSFLGAWVADR